MESYDEKVQLDHYIWDHYGHLITEQERRVGQAAVFRHKAVAYGKTTDIQSPPDDAEDQRWGGWGDSDINAALADGWLAYKRKVRERLYREHGDEIVINRCPACDRVLRTPRAQQCFWCGHDWHQR